MPFFVRRCLFVLGMLLLVRPAAAQEGLQSPEAYLGYELGSRFTPHHRVVDYVEHVATHSPRVQVQEYGTTYEDRPLLLATIAAPGRQDRLDAIRTDHLQRLGVLDGGAAGDDASDDAPAIVWLSYNVHGNEAVSTEAAMEVLYRFADPDDTRTGAWLDDVIVLLDPNLNPDGRERYVHWYRQTVGAQPNPDPDAREHHEPWPYGRTNHYYFDLNRDWAWGVQQETRHRLDQYNRWLPHVHVDFHEQGVDESYYFAPAAEPFHPRITDWQRAFQRAIGTNNARYFDEAGWLYFTREVFDLFYPGYGDTWPTFNGAVGMTYEQGGSGRAGLAVVTAEGDTLTLRDRIDHHVATSLSTVEAVAQHREQVVEEMARYYAQARTEPQGQYRTYVVRRGDDPDRLVPLAQHLDRQGIRYGSVATRRTVRGYSYDDEAIATVTVEPGDLVVPAAQPKGVLTQVLFEPEPELSDSLTYDITAWALPYAYGVEAYALPDVLAADVPFPMQPTRSATVTGPEQPYAYLAAWNDLADARFLADALQAGLKPRYAMQPFETGGRSFEAGTLIFTRTGHEDLGERFDGALRDLAAERGLTLHGVGSGLVTRGADFGSDSVPFLKAPRVALLSGEGLSPYGVGEVWHFFDRQLGYPLTLIDADDLGSVTLYDYDVLVLPRGRYGDVLTDERLADVTEWVQQGGRLIALGSAVEFFAGKEGFSLERAAHAPADSASAPEARLRPFGRRQRAAIPERVPGAVFRVPLDTTHPLAFGYEDDYFTLKRGSDAFAFLEDGWNVGVLRDGTPVSGFAGAAAQQRLTDTLVFGVQPMGRGEVIYLVDDPLFRGFWEHGKLLVANAVFLVGQRTPSTY